MALVYRGDTHDGTPLYYDPEKALRQLKSKSKQEIIDHAAKAGAYDRVVLLPLGDRKYESIEEPGHIAALESLEHPGRYHPRDTDGLPIFDVLLDENGSVVEK